MAVLVSEMKTGSTYAAEVLSHTLYGKAYNYVNEKTWEADRKNLFDLAQDRLLKIHHTDYTNFVHQMPADARAFVTVRNPLDAYLSRVHYHADVCNITFDEAFSHFEKEQWLDKTMQRMLSFINSDDPRIAVIPYEKMIKTPFNIFSDALNKLNISFNEPELKGNCLKFSFKAKTGRNIGQEKAGVHERNGSAGQWMHCNIPQITERQQLSDLYTEILSERKI